MVQEISFRLAGDARIVADASASDGAAARMAGDSPVWGIQLPIEQLLSREGKWVVWITARTSGAQDRGIGHHISPKLLRHGRNQDEERLTA